MQEQDRQKRYATKGQATIYIQTQALNKYAKYRHASTGKKTATVTQVKVSTVRVLLKGSLHAVFKSLAM